MTIAPKLTGLSSISHFCKSLSCLLLALVLVRSDVFGSEEVKGKVRLIQRKTPIVLAELDATEISQALAFHKRVEHNAHKMYGDLAQHPSVEGLRSSPAHTIPVGEVIVTDGQSEWLLRFSKSGSPINGISMECDDRALVAEFREWLLASILRGSAQNPTH